MLTHILSEEWRYFDTRLNHTSKNRKLRENNKRLCIMDGGSIKIFMKQSTKTLVRIWNKLRAPVHSYGIRCVVKRGERVDRKENEGKTGSLGDMIIVWFTMKFFDIALLPVSMSFLIRFLKQRSEIENKRSAFKFHELIQWN